MGRRVDCREPATLSTVGQLKVPNVMFVNQDLTKHPLATCGRNQYVTFCRIQSNLAPCDSLYTKTPSLLTHTSCRPSLLYTHQCLRKESFCVLGLFFEDVQFCNPPPPRTFNRSCTHPHTSATEPLNFSSFTHFC